MSIAAISPKQLYEAVNAGAEIDLLDVRTPVEFAEHHVSFAKNIPLNHLDAAKVAADRKLSPKALYVICRSGTRGKLACEKLLAAGLSNVFNVEGGTLAWQQIELPVVRGDKTISLERQVRIAAGLLVLLGAMLGFFVHPYFVGIAAFVGAGLVFAGITDTCGMGLMLAKMPWNKAAKPVGVPVEGAGACCTPKC